jgi:hypothetical protein
MANVTLHSIKIRKGGYHVQSGSVTAVEPTPQSTNDDKTWMEDFKGKAGEIVFVAALTWLKDWIAEALKLGKEVKLSNVQLEQIGENSYRMVKGELSHVLRIKANSVWEAQVIVFVGQKPFSWTIKEDTIHAEKDITGPGSLAIHFVVVKGKDFEIPPINQSFDVGCELSIDDGPVIASFKRNGWEPQGKRCQSEVFHYT